MLSIKEGKKACLEEKVMKQNYGVRTPVVSVARGNHRKEKQMLQVQKAGFVKRGVCSRVCENVARKKEDKKRLGEARRRGQGKVGYRHSIKGVGWSSCHFSTSRKKNSRSSYWFFSYLNFLNYLHVKKVRQSMGLHTSNWRSL